MKIINKFVALKITEETINDVLYAKLKYGDITGPYYSKTYPETEFDTEAEAYEYTYNKGKYSTWLILPIIKFE